MAQGFGKRVLKPQEQREAKILKQSVLKHFQDLEDPPSGTGVNTTRSSLW